MQTFQGLAVSDGLTVGPVVRIDRGAAGLHRIVCDPFRERALYEAAIVLAKDELNRLQQHACGQDADILMFQIALLEDESFTNEIGDYIAAGAGSAAAVERAEQIFAGRFQQARTCLFSFVRQLPSCSARLCLADCHPLQEILLCEFPHKALNLRSSHKTHSLVRHLLKLSAVALCDHLSGLQDGRSAHAELI